MADKSSVNLSNWRESPYSQYSFHNVDELLSVKPIAKSTAPSTIKQASKPLDSAFKVPVSEQLSMSITDLFKAAESDGLVVLHNGELIYEQYAKDNTRDTRHIVFSATKSMTSLVTGRLIEQGLLGVDDLVIKHLPELAKSAFAHVTVRHLLDMRSGIIYADSEPDYRAACGWGPSNTKQSMLDFFSTLNPPDGNEPGSGFVYATSNTDVLGLVLERASGKSLPQLFHEHIWQPAGAETDAYITVDHAGASRAGGGLCCTVRDFARVGQAVLERKVISDAWLDDILHGGDKQVFRDSAWGPSFKPVSTELTYRSCWTVDGDVGLLIAQGVYGQLLFIDTVNQLVVAKTACQADGTDFKPWGMYYRLFKAIQASVSTVKS